MSTTIEIARPNARPRAVDVEADIGVEVDSRLTGLGRTGAIVTAVGVAATLVGAGLFIVSYPETWTGTGATFDESTSAVRTVVLAVSAGITLILLGASMFFHGRQVFGSGSIDHLSLRSGLERPAAIAPHEGPIEAFTDAGSQAAAWRDEA